jgi:hypothetical protein
MSAPADKQGFLFMWRAAFASEHGPPEATTRAVLHGLAEFMDADGGNCYPAIEAEVRPDGTKPKDLVDVTRLTATCIKTHLRKAKAAGWIVVSTKGFNAQGWRRHAYDPQIPAAVLDAMTTARDVAAGQLNAFTKGGQPDCPPPSEGGQRRLPRRAEGGQPDDQTWSTSRAKVVNHVDLTSPNTIPTTREEGGEPPTPAPAEASMAEQEHLPAEEAQARMWAYLDTHPLRELFPDELRWRTFRAMQGKTIGGTEPQTWWSEKRGSHVTDWRERAELWELAVDAFAEDLVRPGRRPNEAPRPIKSILHYVVIPQAFDRFKQVVSSEPKAGTEHAAVPDSVRSGYRDPGDQRAVRGEGSGMSKLAAVLPKVFAPGEVEAWAVSNPDAAEVADRAALRYAGCDPDAVLSREAPRPTGSAATMYNVHRQNALQAAMAVAAAISPAMEPASP